jgi:sodium/potassium-transporting ATPase subunit beta
MYKNGNSNMLTQDLHGIRKYMFAAYRVAQKLPGGGKNQQVCDFDQPPQDGKVCEVNVKKYQPCTMEMGYSFNRSSPCIFIKLNRVCISCTYYLYYLYASLLYLFLKEHNHLVHQI